MIDTYFIEASKFELETYPHIPMWKVTFKFFDRGREWMKYPTDLFKRIQEAFAAVDLTVVCNCVVPYKNAGCNTMVTFSGKGEFIDAKALAAWSAFVVMENADKK